MGFATERLCDRRSAALNAAVMPMSSIRPGDLVFTGTPPGVGEGMNPKRFLIDGDTLVTEIEGIGAITQRFFTAGQA